MAYALSFHCPQFHDGCSRSVIAFACGSNHLQKCHGFAAGESQPQWKRLA